MRVLECLIAGILLIALASRMFPALRKNTGFPYLPLLAVLILPVHLLVEGYRWQMIPLFVYSLCFLLSSLGRHYLPSGKAIVIRNKFIRIPSKIFISLIFLISVLVPILLPVVHLPEPGGPYAVGTISYRMTDYKRMELFTEDSLDNRSLLVTAWYPAEVKKGMNVSSYWDKEGVTGKTYSINAGMGKFWYSHLSLVKTNSYREASVLSRDKPFPVVIYSPSFYGMNSENTMLFEELASNGYIVFSITHTYETILSIFPDGEAIPGDLDHISELFDSNADQEKQLYEEYKNTASLRHKTELLKKILVVDDLSNQMVKTRMEDAIYVLDEIEKLNSRESIFATKMDLNRVGIMGWSFGGAATLGACMADNRFKAGINMDGWPYGKLFNSADRIAQPMMIMRSESEDEMEDIISNLVLDKIDNSAYLLEIKDAMHTNFWDFPLFFKIYNRIGYWGTIEPLRMLEIESIYIKGFFDQHLKGKDLDLQATASDLSAGVSVKVK